MLVALPLHVAARAAHERDDGTYKWLFLETTDDSFVDSWAKWNYSGYERKPSYPEYRGIVSTMGEVGEEHGCGRAHWEYEGDLNRYGTPMALMLLPFWTDGCIGSMEGLYFESSGTTPFHFLNAAETSVAPSNPVRDMPERPMPYSPFDLDKGVRHLQLMGVRYYMAFSDQAIAAATTNPDLTEVASSPPWKVYEVADSELVEPLVNEPAVLEGMSNANPRVAARRGRLVHGSGGPRRRARARRSGGVAADRAGRGPGAPRAARRRRSPNIVEKDMSISFDVDRVGEPVLVKTSYFPNWEVSGADGPYRVTPNLMVVVPTSKHVSLTYGYTNVEYLGWGTSLAALAVLIWLVRQGPVTFPAKPPRRRLIGEGDDGTRATRTRRRSARSRRPGRRGRSRRSRRPALEAGELAARARRPRPWGSGTQSWRSATRSLRRPTTVRRIRRAIGERAGRSSSTWTGISCDDDPGPLRP